MNLAISGRGRLDHITVSPPANADEDYIKWAQKASIVTSWIDKNLEPNLVNQFLDYPMAKDIWKGIESMLSSGHDGLQKFYLKMKANSSKQGMVTIEVYCGKLMNLWKEIDRRVPNPMRCSKDITMHNAITQQNRVYQFLVSLNNTFDKDRRDLVVRDEKSWVLKNTHMKKT